MAETDTATTATKSVGSGLKKQVGPLPVGVWIAIIAGGLLIAYYFNKKNGASSSSQPQVDTGGNPAVGTGLVSAGIPGGVTTPNPSTQPVDNAGWLSLAEAQAVRDGYNPVTAAGALNTFLNGGTLQPDQATLVQRIVSELESQGINIPTVPSGGSIATTPTGGGGSTGSPPSTPTGLHVLPGQVSSISVGLGWNAVPGATGYRVGVRNNANTTNPWSYQSIGPGTSTTVGALHGKTLYEFTIQAQNASGLSGYPPAIFVRTA